MKTRNGFVSNSSSSSFICLGVNIESWETLYNKLGIDLPYYDKDEGISFYEDIEDHREFNKALKKLGLDIVYDGSDDIAYLGYSSGYFDELEEFELTLDNITKIKDKLISLGYSENNIKIIGKTIYS